MLDYILLHYLINEISILLHINFRISLKLFLKTIVKVIGGTRWRSWLMHCDTGRKVAGFIPDCVTGIFHCHNPSGRGVVSASNRNEYQEYFLRGKGVRYVGLTTLPL